MAFGWPNAIRAFLLWKSSILCDMIILQLQSSFLVEENFLSQRFGCFEFFHCLGFFRPTIWVWFLNWWGYSKPWIWKIPIANDQFLSQMDNSHSEWKSTSARQENMTLSYSQAKCFCCVWVIFYLCWLNTICTWKFRSMQLTSDF